MDLEPQDGSGEDFAGGEYDVVKLTMEHDGHTYIYTYPEHEAPLLLDVLCHQAGEGWLPTIAAAILGELAIEGFDNADF